MSISLSLRILFWVFVRQQNHTINHVVYYSLLGHCESMDVFVKHTNITQHQLATNTPLYFHTSLHFNKASYSFYGPFNYVYLSSCSHVQGCSLFQQMQDMDHKTQSPKYKSHFYASAFILVSYSLTRNAIHKKTYILFRSIFNHFNADERSL